MKTTLFLSVSIDGLIANKDGIPLFPDGAWEDWCSLVNDADNVIAGRSSYEQLQNDDMASVLHPTHKIVLSARDIELGDSSWQRAKSPKEALAMLENKGIQEAMIGGGRAVAHSFMRERLIVPSFMETLEVVLSEMLVEKVILADEIKQHNPGILVEIINLIGEVPIEFITHEEFKEETKGSRAIIRTGEFSPYANIILISGVVF